LTVGESTPSRCLTSSNDANPTPPKRALISSRACTPTKSPATPSAAAMVRIAAKALVPGGSTPVACVGGHFAYI
jgi:hypothetical protein